MEEIIKRCNLINSDIGSIVRIADRLFKKSVFTTGGYILVINDTHVQDQSVNAFSDEVIKKIVREATKV
ncbi:hypothetical protein [Lewinella cohaerens]|uniref:hypothetical protein n=1 Tax=Lewinella cohaerens TaxID=70995 RepID=UPI000374D451|nr:hypothetical protein [Lewinella cohaerens]